MSGNLLPLALALLLAHGALSTAEASVVAGCRGQGCTSLLGNGSNLVVGTEHDTGITTAPGSYEFHVDTCVLQAGDTLEVRVKLKAHPSGNYLGYVISTYTGVQPVDTCHEASVPFGTEFPAKVTLKQTTGTGRKPDWYLRKLDN